MKLPATIIYDEPAPRRLPFREHPCKVHLIHRPVPASVELHHIFPKYLQSRAYGDDKVRDRELVPICGTGHSDVHLAIDATMDALPMPRGVGRAERALAQEAIRRFTKARS